MCHREYRCGSNATNCCPRRVRSMIASTGLSGNNAPIAICPAKGRYELSKPTLRRRSLRVLRHRVPPDSRQLPFTEWRKWVRTPRTQLRECFVTESFGNKPFGLERMCGGRGSYRPASCNHKAVKHLRRTARGVTCLTPYIPQLMIDRKASRLLVLTLGAASWAATAQLLFRYSAFC